MQYTVKNDTPFQILTSAIVIGPSQTGYVLEVAADGKNFSPLFTVGANVTRQVTNLSSGAYYRLNGNVGDVVVNWVRSCVTEGGSGGSGVTYTAGDYIDITQDVISVTGITPDLYLTSADTENFLTSADTENLVSSAQVQTQIDAALSGFTPAGDSTVLKAVTDFPEDPEMGDMVSKLAQLPTFSWNTSDGVTAKMHLNTYPKVPDQNYDVITFTAADGDALVVLGYWEEEEYPWQVQIYVDGDMVESWDIYWTGETYSIELEDGHYASIGFIADDYSGLGGGMLQIGYTDGTFGNWDGGLNNIPDLVLDDVYVEGVPVEYAADGPAYYDGEKWVNVADKVKKETEAIVLPRMPYLDLNDGVDNTLSAIFDENDEGNPKSAIYLLDTAYDWVDTQVNWAADADVFPFFTIDPDDEDGPVAYIENIPAGNYIFALYKEEPGENYDSEFQVSYYSKEAGEYDVYTGVESTNDVWNNPDFEISDYWRNKFGGNVVVSKSGEWYNWSFPKDVARFEFRVLDAGQGNQYVETNIEYKDVQGQIDTMDEVVSAALVDLDEKKVESEDIHNIVRIEQSDYDALVAQSATTSTTLYVVIPDQQ